MRSPSGTLRLRSFPGLLLAVALAIATPCFSAGFAPHVDYGTGNYPSTVAVGDLNADGKLDIVTANYLDQTVSVLLGDGLGVFGSKSDFACGGPAFPVAIADLDGDGKPDLAVGNYDTGTISVLLGNGDGTFGGHIDYATGGTPYAIAVADVNGDGKLDIVNSNDQSDNISVLLNNGDGTFGGHTEFGTGSAPSGVAIGDLNGDGKLDVVTPNSSVYGGPTGNTVSVLLGNGDGTFGTNTNFDTGTNPLSVAMADLNGDGKPDLAVADQVSDVISVLLGDGTGSFGPRTDFATGRDPGSVAIVDVDGDTRLDLVTANSSVNTVSVLLGNGDGSFGGKTDYGTGPSPFFVTVGDLNGDGAPDLVTANAVDNTASVLLNTGGPTPTLLARFDAVMTEAGTELWWQFGEPGRVASAALERAVNQIGPWLSVTPEIQRVGEATKALDQSAERGQSYYYRLTAHLTNGTEAVFGPIRVAALAAIELSGLTGIEPNPAPANARIDFTLVRAEKVRITVVDVAGREQAVLSDGLLTPGSYSTVWDGRSGGTRLPAGMYFVRWSSAATTVQRKLVLTQ